MNRILIGTAIVALVASAAGAQIVGGGTSVGGAVGVGGLGGVATHGNAAAGADIGPNVRGTVGAVTDAGDAGTRAASDTTTMATHAADGAVHSAAHVATGAAASDRTVTVKAGARTQVTRETRCYDGTDYYDPYFSDGAYYCEGRSTGAGVAVKAKVGG